ncbi:hypothetical protein [Halalkalibacterium ligniniphilum]|uniref:hypothetical protein n=1 Tax=Halalkalibacterium ligniniphilum TaxID=1134413 RepID=UPI00034DCF24|nr:hypothetical protein [Halalkalibacterium ligniniphilum]
MPATASFFSGKGDEASVQVDEIMKPFASHFFIERLLTILDGLVSIELGRASRSCKLRIDKGQ